jgi:hypothetical protein
MDWVAVVGILGTLAGVLIGAFTTWMIQERQLKHADATRFHQQRIELYAACSQAANHAFSSWAVGMEATESVSQFLRSFERIRFVCSKQVLEKLLAVHNELGAVLASPDKKFKAGELLDSFNTAMFAFQSAARRELSVTEDA